MSFGMEQHPEPLQRQSLEALTSEEADLREHVFALLGSVYLDALTDEDRYIRSDNEVSFGVPIRSFRMDSIYPVLREDYTLEPNHLIVFIPTDENPQQLRRFWAEWDIKRMGKHAQVVDMEGARPYKMRASEREAEQESQQASLKKSIATFENNGGENIEPQDVVEPLYTSLENSLHILRDFYRALRDEYRLVPYRPDKV
jgi:hypothetical protein